MAITTKDIAKVCGVSRGSVDRALNNRGRINQQTKEKILKVAEEMGYRPDLLARSLAKGRTMCIGVIVFDILNHYFAQMVNAIENEAKNHGYFVNVTFQEKDPEMEIQLLNNLVDRRVDGIIICPVNKGVKFTKFIESLQVPVIVIGNYVSPKIPYMGIDEKKAAVDATNFIISKGYKRIVFVCPPISDRKKENIYSHEQRMKGFLSIVEIKENIEYFIVDNWGYLEEVKHIIDSNTEKTAVYCSGDKFALDIMRYMRKCNKNAPEDYGLMGFDNIDTLEYIVPSLATVHNPINKIGELSVQGLIKLIEKEEISKYEILEHNIICGDSI